MSQHVKINGIWYRLAEDAEGQHYVKGLQPLRPPNAQLVQGDPGTFQIRPDLLQWRQKSWAGGEGQIKFDPSLPNRSFTIQHGDPFSKPGTVQPAPICARTQDATPGNAPGGYLAHAIGNLYHITSLSYRTWTGTQFSAATAISGPTNALERPVGDAVYLFVHESGTNNIYRFDGSTWIKLNDQCANSNADVRLAELGDYVYVWAPSIGQVFEISKATANTTTAETVLHYVPVNSNLSADSALMVAGDNRIYIATSDGQKTMIHEIIPTSAAGDGFGSEIAVMYGVEPEALFYAGGTLFMIGHDETPDNTVGPDRQIFYIDPQGSYGTLGSIRGLYPLDNSFGPATLLPYPAHGGKLGKMAFVLPSNTEAEGQATSRLDLWEIDLLTGGYACIAGDAGQETGASQQIGLVFHEGRYIASSSGRVFDWDMDDRTGDKTRIVSPSNDFDLTGEKILESIDVTIDPLPTGGTVTLGYILDDGAEVQQALSLSVGETGGTFTVSTDTATKTFRSMQYTVELDGSSDIPVLRSIDLWVRVNRRIRVWDLLLDASDDAAPQGFNGTTIINNILDIGDNTVVDFIDNYDTHNLEGAKTQLDVVVDAASVSLSQQGEGVLAVRLMEVV